MKFCPVLPGSWQYYKLFKNFILWLLVKSFIPARRVPCLVLLGSRFAETKFSHAIVSVRLSGMKKLTHLFENIRGRTFQWMDDISIVFLRRIWCQSTRKKILKCLCRISLFYRSNHRKHSAKKIILKILRFSQENNSVGVSVQWFSSAILSKRDSNIDVFKWILRTFFKSTYFEEHLRTTASYFMKRNRHSRRLNNSSKNS